MKNLQLLQVERDPEPLRLDLGLEAGPMQGVPSAHQAEGQTGGQAFIKSHYNLQVSDISRAICLKLLSQSHMVSYRQVTFSF